MKYDISYLLNKNLGMIADYTPGKSREEVARELGITGITKMASNENPFGISPLAGQAIIQAVQGAYAYPEVSAYDLRRELAEYLNLPAQNIIIGNGADSMIYTIAMTVLNPGDEVIIPQITFSVYETISRCMGARIVYSPLENLSIDLNDILKQITPKTKIIWLCNPNNPTGVYILRGRWKSFLERVPPSVMIVHDEVYFDFAPKAEFPDSVAELKAGRNNLFCIRSFSKAFGLAGVRLGYGLGAEKLINILYRIRPPFDVSRLAVAAGVGALSDKAFYDKTLALVRTEKEFLYRELDRLKINYVPSGTNFIILDTGREAQPVFEALLKKGIIIRPLSDYKLPAFIRLTIGLHAQNEFFIKSLKEVLAC